MFKLFIIFKAWYIYNNIYIYIYVCVQIIYDATVLSCDINQQFSQSTFPLIIMFFCFFLMLAFMFTHEKTVSDM